jgi:hypothetical protein
LARFWVPLCVLRAFCSLPPHVTTRPLRAAIDKLEQRVTTLENV